MFVRLKKQLTQINQNINNHEEGELYEASTLLEMTVAGFEPATRGL